MERKQISIGDLIIKPETKEEMERFWFTADLHFLHPKIVDICERPTTVDDNNEWILERINSRVKKKDHLYILGDVSMGNKKKTEVFLDKMNGMKYLIEGNHDKSIRNSTRFEQVTKYKNFNYSRHGLNIHIVLFHHCIVNYERKEHGSWHLFGHSHTRELPYVPERSFDIGLDRKHWWYPYNLYEIYQVLLLLERGHDIEHIIKHL
jgi:calcineurin-like phosphoesterase family protein